MPSELEKEVAKFRKQTDSLWNDSATQLATQYKGVRTELQSQISDLEADLAAAPTTGRSARDLQFRLARSEELLRQTEALVDYYGKVSKATVTAAQRDGIKAALGSAGQQLGAVGATTDPAVAKMVAGWASVPNETIKSLTGALQATAPVGQIFDSFGSDARRTATTEIVRSVALGQSPATLARRLNSIVNVPLNRAMTIARTELMRATNETLRLAFTQSGVCKGWRWSAALSTRTCAACLSNNGRVFPLTTPMARHVNCRCSMSPWVGDGRDAEWLSGEDWLAGQPDKSIVKVLGKAGAKAYLGGTPLSNWLAYSLDPVWGGAYYQASTKVALGGTRTKPPPPPPKPPSNPYAEVLRRAEQAGEVDLDIDQFGIRRMSQLDKNERYRVESGLMSGKPHQELGMVDFDISGKVFVSIQNKVRTGDLRRLVKEGIRPNDNDPIEIRKFGGQYYIMEGNHRVVAALIRGDKTIRVRFTDLDLAAPAPPQPKPVPIPKQPVATKGVYDPSKHPAGTVRYDPTMTYPAKGLHTVDEAEAWLTKKYPNVKFDLVGVHPTLIDKAMRQFDTLAMKYPYTLDTLRYFGTYNTTSKLPFGGRNDFGNGTLAHANERLIALNPQKWGYPNTMTMNLQRMRETNWAQVSTPERIITHEFGHTLDFRLGHSRASMVPTDNDLPIGSMQHLFNKAYKAPPELSTYSQANIRESWAEGFTQMTHTPPDRQYKYTRQMATYLENVGDESLWYAKPPVGKNTNDGTNYWNNLKEEMDKIT